MKKLLRHADDIVNIPIRDSYRDENDTLHLSPNEIATTVYATLALDLWKVIQMVRTPTNM